MRVVLRCSTSGVRTSSRVVSEYVWCAFLCGLLLWCLAVGCCVAVCCGVGCVFSCVAVFLCGGSF